MPTTRHASIAGFSEALLHETAPNRRTLMEEMV